MTKPFALSPSPHDPSYPHMEPRAQGVGPGPAEHEARTFTITPLPITPADLKSLGLTFLGADADYTVSDEWPRAPGACVRAKRRENFCLAHSSGYPADPDFLLAPTCHLANAMREATRPARVAVSTMTPCRVDRAGRRRPTGPGQQSQKASFTEACVGTAIGMAVSLVLQYTVLPLYGLPDIGFSGHFSIVMIFTLASVARGYLVRRLFNSFH